MPEIPELYKCEICGNIAEIVINKGGVLVCCGEKMKKLTPSTTEAGEEKHLPIIERENGGVKVKIGEIPHPMSDEHYIQFIEAISDDLKYLKRKYLNPNEEAVLKFKCGCSEKIISREYCNIHGLWQNSEK